MSEVTIEELSKELDELTIELGHVYSILLRLQNRCIHLKVKITDVLNKQKDSLVP